MELISIIVFLLLTLISSIFFHYKIKNIFISSILAALVTSIIFQVFGFLVLGYLDPFFLIAFIASLLISFLVAMLIGIPFLRHREKGNNSNNE